MNRHTSNWAAMLRYCQPKIRISFRFFQQKKIDAVWTVEPWVSRLENEAGGKVLVKESDAATTVLVSSARFLNEKRELASKFVQANRDLTD